MSCSQGRRGGGGEQEVGGGQQKISCSIGLIEDSGRATMTLVFIAVAVTTTSNYQERDKREERGTTRLSLFRFRHHGRALRKENTRFKVSNAARLESLHVQLYKPDMRGNSTEQPCTCR